MTLLLGGCSGESEKVPEPGTGGGGGGDQAGSTAPGLDAPPGKPTLRARQEFRMAGKPQGVCFADLNGDGRDELIAVCAAPPGLSIWGSEEGLIAELEIPDYPLNPQALTLGDATHPTHVALASRATSELIVVDLDSQQQLALPGVPRAFAVGDLGADGLQEFVVATREGELVLIDAQGSQTSTELPESASTCILVREGGVWVGSQSDASLRWFEHTSSGLRAREKIDLPGIPRDIFESEGEVFVAGGDRALWRLMPGGAVLALELGAIPISLDGRGNTLLGVSFTSLTYFILQGGGIVHQEYAGQDVWDGAIGDFDGDGVADVAFANRDAHRVSLVRSVKARQRPREAQRIPVDRGPHSLAATDLNGDGTREILVVHALSDRILTLEATNGTYRVRSRLPAGGGADRVSSGDVNGDGNPDALWLVRSGSGLVLRAYLGDGEGKLGPDMLACELSARTEGGDLLLADLDADGDVEVLVADTGSGLVRVIDGTTTASGYELVERSTLAVPSAPCALTALDDGRFAVAVGAPGPRIGFAVLFAEGLQLSEAEFIATEQAPVDVAALEFSGQAPHELALLTRRGDGPGKLIVFGKNPGGWTVLDSDSTGLRPYALSTGDIDGDGRDEIVVGAQNSHNVGLWHRNGGSLKRLPDLGAGRGVLDVLLVDLDGDGRSDLVVANNFSNDVSVAESLSH